WRNRFRAVKGVQALKDLAAEARAGTLPAPTLFLLGEFLVIAGDRPAAVQVLRQAQQRYPSDFWINHQLALHLRHSEPPELEEALRFYTAVLALRPRNAAVHLNFGVALARKGDLDGAIREFQEALRLRKDSAAHLNLGAALDQKGDVGGAVKK